MKYLYMVLMSISLFTTDTFAQNNTIYPTTVEELASTSVKIMNKEDNRGGSGVIYQSFTDHSIILTNDHICGLLDKGGTVYQGNKSYQVVSYKMSRVHDVCMLTVNSNLKVSTVLANEAPDLYSEAVVSGHPALLPHIVSRGTFSSKSNINVMIGYRPCTAEEKTKNAMQCTFTPGMPVLRSFEAQILSCLILPGSSGSAVFNSDGEISGLVFASGSRELSYAIIVPYEYVESFVNRESLQLPWVLTVNDNSQGQALVPDSFKLPNVYNNLIFDMGD